jgi:hypothetical protein
MIWKAKYTIADYRHGTTRLKRIFAWLPTYIDGSKIWLDTYEILQVYIIENYPVVLDEASPKEITSFYRGKWVDVSKRLIK